ncbi:MAG: hypothetical protein WBH14_10945 [Albidovulum sp.]
MAQEDFEARLARIGTKERPSAATATRESGRLDSAPRWRGAIWGGLASAAVLVLFANLQAISDAAPEAIRNSDTPGAFGAPVAILSVLWFAAIPMWFVGSVLKGALSMKGFFFPRPFVTGAFAVLAAGLAFLKLGT